MSPLPVTNVSDAGGVVLQGTCWYVMDPAAGPAGLIFGEVNPVMVQGVVTAGIPLVAGIEREFFDVVQTGATVRIGPARKIVQVV